MSLYVRRPWRDEIGRVAVCGDLQIRRTKFLTFGLDSADDCDILTRQTRLASYIYIYPLSVRLSHTVSIWPCNDS